MMKVISPSFEIITPIDPAQILKTIEAVGRTCYKSEDKITDDSCIKFVKNIIDRGHEAVIEHYNITVRLTNDRGVSHEEVRHRIASYAQESTRYCCYSKDKFDNQVTYIDLLGGMKLDAQVSKLDVEKFQAIYDEWIAACLKLRTSPAAHPQIREVMIPLLKAFKLMLPVVFDDIEVD